MHAWYPELRILHICAVVASGALFVARALAVNLAGAGWPMRRRVRILAYGVDTTLLAAAVMLTTIIGQYPLVSAWLTAKLVLLVLYILLGYAALRGRTHAVRLICLAGAAATYGFIVTVARAHHPLGLLAGS
ncbi:SirB2 family protein [Allosphingosinicella sp.]|uniref:SirB2 family protein n=1 Tax=Allosphingosinicella sp. TaxID=2823234 RepID=UPI003784796A